MKKIKIVNPIRFTNFLLSIIIIITTICCYKINKITTEKIEKGIEISRVIENSIILSSEEQEALERFIQEEETEINEVKL